MEAEVAHFYDERWTGFRYANRLKLLRASAILNCLAAARLAEPSILEVGCGAGWLTNILSMFGPAVGIDLSAKATATARERFPHVEFFAADLRTWRPSRTFDVIVAHEVLEHFERHQDFVDTVCPLLSPKGVLIVTTPNETTLAAMPPAVRSSFQEQPVENTLTARRLEALLSPRFRTLYSSTAVPGFGSRGVRYRLLQSRRVWRALDSIFGPGVGERLACRAGLGLHLVWMGELREAGGKMT